jgi:hypothetical protein
MFGSRGIGAGIGNRGVRLDNRRLKKKEGATGGGGARIPARSPDSQNQPQILANAKAHAKGQTNRQPVPKQWAR